MERIRREHERKADDYRNQKSTWIMQQNSSKSSKSKNLFPKPTEITKCNGGVGVGCFDSSIWQGHISGLLDWLCKTTIKQKFCISQKWKLPFPHLFHRKSPFHFRFHFRQKISVFISVPQISVFASIFSFCFRFSTEKVGKFPLHFHPYLEVVSFSYWSIKLWFHTKGKTYCYTHHTFLLGFPTGLSTRRRNKFFWHRCRGERGFLQGESLTSNLFTLLLFCLVSFLYFCLHLFYQKYKKISSFYSWYFVTFTFSSLCWSLSTFWKTYQ
jgi:hypothetical protein